MKFCDFFFFILFSLNITINSIGQNIQLVATQDYSIVDQKANSHFLRGGYNRIITEQVDVDFDGDLELIIIDCDGKVVELYEHDFSAESGIFPFSIMDPNIKLEYVPFNSWTLFKDLNGDEVVDQLVYTSTFLVDQEISLHKGYQDKLIKFDESPVRLMRELSNGELTPITFNARSFPFIHDVNQDGHLDLIIFKNSTNALSYYAWDRNEDDKIVYRLIDECFKDLKFDFSDEVITSAKLCSGFDSQITPENRSIHADEVFFAIDKTSDLELAYVSNSLNPNVNLLAPFQDSYQLLETEFPDGSYNLKNFPIINQIKLPDDKWLHIYSPFDEIESKFTQAMDMFSGTSLELETEESIKNDFDKSLLDVGRHSIPVIFDINNDTREDILIIHDSLRVNFETQTTSIPCLLNMSDDQSLILQYDTISFGYPIFENNYDLSFADFTNDGRTEALIITENGGVTLVQQDKNSPIIFEPIPIQINGGSFGRRSRISTIDMDQDGYSDLIIGDESGQISYWKNTSTNSQNSFELIDQRFGDITLDSICSNQSYSSPTIFTTNNQRYLLISTPCQIDFLYNISDPDDIFFVKKFHLRNGNFSEYSVMENFLIAGNIRGGISVYEIKEDISNSVEPTKEQSFKIYPQPAMYEFIIELDGSYVNTFTIELYTMEGIPIYEKKLSTHRSLIRCDHLKSGMYILKMTSNNLELSRLINILK